MDGELLGSEIFFSKTFPRPRLIIFLSWQLEKLKYFGLKMAKRKLYGQEEDRILRKTKSIFYSK